MSLIRLCYSPGACKTCQGGALPCCALVDLTPSLAAPGTSLSTLTRTLPYFPIVPDWFLWHDQRTLSVL